MKPKNAVPEEAPSVSKGKEREKDEDPQATPVISESHNLERMTGLSAPKPRSTPKGKNKRKKVQESDIEKEGTSVEVVAEGSGSLQDQAMDMTEG